jgi:hypothetical protein
MNHEFIFGGTGFRPVVSGVAPKTGSVAGSMRWLILKTLIVGARSKSGATPDFTGVTPVLP